MSRLTIEEANTDAPRAYGYTYKRDTATETAHTDEVSRRLGFFVDKKGGRFYVEIRFDSAQGLECSQFIGYFNRAALIAIRDHITAQLFSA